MFCMACMLSLAFSLPLSTPLSPLLLLCRLPHTHTHTPSLSPRLPLCLSPPTIPRSPNKNTQDLAFKLLPYRVDAGARAHHERAAGEEIDWAALAKGRHTYKERLQRGEVAALSVTAQAQQDQEHPQQQESASMGA